MQCIDEAFESTLNHIFNEGFLALHRRASGCGDLARVLRIQDPRGKANYFAFDQGWREMEDSHDGNSKGAAPLNESHPE
jgi:hypothetical protein